jgi:phosphate transport system permease protein
MSESIAQSAPQRFETLSAAAASDRVQARLRRRNRSERVFRLCGLAAVTLALAALASLLVSIASQGHGAFRQSVVRLEVHFDAQVLTPDGAASVDVLRSADYAALLRASLAGIFPEVEERKARRRLTALLSRGAPYVLQDLVLADPGLLGSRRVVELPLSADADSYFKGRISAEVPEENRSLGDDQIAWLQALDARGAVETIFNWGFLGSGDSREPELAGIGGALMGSLLTLFVTFVLSFPIGVATAVYLQEFAPKGRITDWIEVNISNLAAVPSIVFGLLGLAVFLALFGLPRSAPLVGGMVLALMTLPTIIIAGRAAIAAVPPSIREAALALGASPLQVVGHHVLPMALPGILTGTIIGMSRALGESAPLLMIGMVAFIVDVPTGLSSPASVLPVQIFLWSDAPERAFVEKTAGAIGVLLLLLLAMNGTAVWQRHRFERRSRMN